jgi:hypothetical protein
MRIFISLATDSEELVIETTWTRTISDVAVEVSDGVYLTTSSILVASEPVVVEKESEFFALDLEKSDTPYV